MSSSDDQPPGKPPGDRGSRRTLPPPQYRGPAEKQPPAALPPSTTQRGPAIPHQPALQQPAPQHPEQQPAPPAASQHPAHQPAPPPPAQQPAPPAASQHPAQQPAPPPPAQQPAPPVAAQHPITERGPALAPQGTMLFPPAPMQPPTPAAAPHAWPASEPVPHSQQPSGPTQSNSGPPPHASSGPVPYPNQPSGPTQPYPGGIVPGRSSGIPHSHSGPSFGQPSFGGSGPAAHDPAFAALPQASIVNDGQYQAPDAGDSLDEIPGSQFVKFLKISARRAFRLRIEPNEVLPDERRALLRASPPITDLNLQAFLAWRRSVLFLVACVLVPLTVIGLSDALTSTKYKAIFFVKFMPAFAELVFLVICWSQLKRWAHWRSQRRKLFYGWLLFMLTPFIVFVYPLNTIYIELRKQLGSVTALQQLGIDGVYKQAVLPFVFSMLAMLQLAPKAISLMPGLIRSSMVIKLLFPGSSAPGWLIVMASPMYALLAYVILIIPYQFTGSGWFVAGILGVIAAQSVLARAGFQLARPLSEEEALRQIKKVRRYYISVMILSAVLIIVALGSLVAKLNLRATDVILAVLKFESNVLILTMIGADLVVTNLDKARHYTAGRDHVEESTENKIAAFVSFEAPPPPPPGPAQ